MVLRLHFTAQDLEYVRIARSPDPFWEIVCSVRQLQTGEGALAFGPWRRAVAPRLRAGGPDRAVALAMRGLVPPGLSCPDFLPSAPDDGDAGPLRGGDPPPSTPRSRLRRELTLLAASGPLARPLTGERQGERGDTAALRNLGGLLAAYDAAFIHPYRHWIDAAVASDVAWRCRELAAGGTRALLDTFRPMARWSPPVLEVTHSADRDLHLAGRGLLLTPSYFCWRRPIARVDGARLPMLVYPVEKPVQPPSAPGRTAAASLSRLLGATRAALLYEVAAHGCATTSELADAVGCSLPNTSQQLAILRGAGLAASRKEGRCVLHRPSPLGRRLLETAGP
ncbi:ArsR/SmtB family transcription factor [Streptomyces pratensis]|uniref:ArsR/SmtB family transcription factor n=1 Tax=Streptomyces pratensis TaxID=1169025 RepID=UPI003016EEE1